MILWQRAFSAIISSSKNIHNVITTPNSVLNVFGGRRVWDSCQTGQSPLDICGKNGGIPPYAISGSSGGSENGSFIYWKRSILMKVLSLNDAVKLERHQGRFAIRLRYWSRRIVIRAVQIWISTAFWEVPRKLLMCRFCLRFLKKISIFQRERYSAAIVLAACLKSLVYKSIV